MALSSSTATKGVVVTVPVLVLSASATAIFLLFSLSSSSSSICFCPAPTTGGTGGAAGTTGGAAGTTGGPEVSGRFGERISPTAEDVKWVKDQIEANGLHMQDNVLRKGINPRTRAQQLEDLIQFKGISHYGGEESKNHTALACPGELLVEEHHRNYGEPWAGGRDVFEFLADSVRLSPDARVLEIGCGTLRVGLHFVRYLYPGHFHCLERDDLSLMAAFRYDLPSQGLLHKRPVIVKGEDMDFRKFGSGMYNLIYASAVFLHMPDNLVWLGLERLANKLKPYEGRIFVSHNIKFCSRLGGEQCTKRLNKLGLEYIGKHTHDSLLFNHYEIWFEFKRTKA